MLGQSMLCTPRGRTICRLETKWRWNGLHWCCAPTLVVCGLLVVFSSIGMQARAICTELALCNSAIIALLVSMQSAMAMGTNTRIGLAVVKPNCSMILFFFDL